MSGRRLAGVTPVVCNQQWLTGCALAAEETLALRAKTCEQDRNQSVDRRGRARRHDARYGPRLARRRCHGRRASPAWRTAERQMQPDLGPLNGNLPSPRHSRESCGSRASGGLSERRGVGNDRDRDRTRARSHSLRGPSDTPRKNGPDTSWPTPEPTHRINQKYFEPDAVRVRCIQSTHSSFSTAWPSKISCRTSTASRPSPAISTAASNCRSPAAISSAATAASRGSEKRSAPNSPARPKSSACNQPASERRNSSICCPESAHGCIFRSIRGAAEPRSQSTGGKRGQITIPSYDGEKEFDSVDRDWAIRAILGVGPDFRYEVISKEDWIGRRLVADRFRDRRAFICGDAAHLWIPTRATA